MQGRSGLPRGPRRWAAVALSLALVACQPVPPPPLKVGVNAWVGYDPLVLAREKGLMDAQQVKVIELSSSSESLRNVRNGLIDAAALTLDEALRLADEGMDVKIVAVLDASAGGDVVVASEAVGGLDQLRGKTIAVESTTVGAVMLRRLLQAAGLKEADVVVHHMEAGQHLAALRSQRIDAVVTYEPFAGALSEAGFRAIFDSRQAPGDIVDVLVVRADVLAARAEQVDALLTGWQRGLLALEHDPAGGAQLLSQGLGMAPERYLATLRGLRFYSARQSLDLLSGQPKPLGQASERLVATLMEMGVVQKAPDWDRLLVAPGAAQGEATP